MKNLFSFCCLVLLFSSCETANDTNPVSMAVPAALSADHPFNDYWFAGKAEISSYDLVQARYGEQHRGEAALVFVTEPFSKSKQVKLDNAAAAGKDKQDVLKLNMTKKFYTGIYPYSMMLSTFTPIDLAQAKRPLKISTSSQEWCGHTFTQYNLNGKKYDIKQYSYFESEGDEETNVSAIFTEDEIWSQLRMNPTLLPTGKFKVVPGSFFTRLRHTSFAAVNATASQAESEDGMAHYNIEFADGRKLQINYTAVFPFAINSWTETMASGLVTTATLKKRIQLDYWNRNGVADGKYREELGLVGF